MWIPIAYSIRPIRDILKVWNISTVYPGSEDKGLYQDQMEIGE